MHLLDGRPLAQEIQRKVKDEIAHLKITPGLAVILVGDNPASHLYVSLKEKAAKAVGIRFEKHVFSGIEPPSKILTRIQELNARADIQAILVQVPLPPGYDEDVVISQIDPKKDVDGFHQVNLRALLSGEPRIFTAVALAIVALVDAAASATGRNALNGLHALLLVNRMEFAAPLEYLLEKMGAEVRIILRPKEVTPEIQEHLKHADIVVVARGRKNFIRADMLKDGVIVIDAGTNQLPNGQVVGDVDFNSTHDKPGIITPVPGGVGPMTVAMLLKNTLALAKSLSKQ